MTGPLSSSRCRRARLAKAGLALPALLALAACTGDDLTRTFGLTRDAPDEFVVTTQAPLSMPPDFSLRPPEPGAPRPQTQPLSQQAEAALVPNIELQGTAGGMSAGQEALVQQAGPPAPDNIRNQVDQEAARDQPNQGFIDTLMFWKTPPAAGVVVDAQKENQRLQQDAALGQSPTVGQTPIIQRQPQSLLGNLF